MFFKKIIKKIKRKKRNFKVLDFNTNKAENTLSSNISSKNLENKNLGSKNNLNVVDIKYYRKEEDKVLKSSQKIEGKNTNVSYLKPNFDKKNYKVKHTMLCLNCYRSLTFNCKTSNVSDTGDYIYVSCNDCGFVMKLNKEGELKKPGDTLKEISEAYRLFEGNNHKPLSYSYTENGEKHLFRNVKNN